MVVNKHQLLQASNTVEDEIKFNIKVDQVMVREKKKEREERRKIKSFLLECRFYLRPLFLPSNW